MKTFAEYLPTMTARERKIVEAFFNPQGSADEMLPTLARRILKMHATPPAKEPVSVEGEAVGDGDTFTSFFFPEESPKVKPGDRVRVVKIEEVQQ